MKNQYQYLFEWESSMLVNYPIKIQKLKWNHNTHIIMLGTINILFKSLDSKQKRAALYDYHIIVFSE